MKKLADRALAITPSVTLGIDAKAKKMAAAGIQVINFGVGEPDFDTPAHIAAAGIKAIQGGQTRYTPASGTEKLRQAVCQKLASENGLEYTPGEIVVSNGAKHSIYNALLALCDEGDEVIVPAPYWVSYPEMVKMAGGVPVIVATREEDDFKMSPAQLLAHLTPRTKAVILNSPSNPTGMVYTADELRALADVCVAQQLYVISDEIYEKLVYDTAQHVSIASFGPAIKELTILVNGMSKAYAMTGWRIGYTASNAKLASAMGSLQSHATSNPNSIAQAASVEALTGSQAEIGVMLGEFARRRVRMAELLIALPGVSCRMPQGAFYILANMSRLLGASYGGVTVEDDVKLAELLLEKAHVAVVPGSGFGSPGYMRLSYATSLANIELGLERIKQFLAT